MSLIIVASYLVSIVLRITIYGAPAVAQQMTVLASLEDDKDSIPRPLTTINSSSDTLSGLCWYCTHMVHRHIQAKHSSYTYNKYQIF